MNNIALCSQNIIRSDLRWRMVLLLKEEVGKPLRPFFKKRVVLLFKDIKAYASCSTYSEPIERQPIEIQNNNIFKVYHSVVTPRHGNFCVNIPEINSITKMNCKVKF